LDRALGELGSDQEQLGRALREIDGRHDNLGSTSSGVL